ncbi:hypothetical protein C8J57DRAFT_1640641 [Mycena rebaudengoi]|nr:hypothetical protein C8J57DRAFT_1640641 [Mycena rebaudengoi]
MPMSGPRRTKARTRRKSRPEFTISISTVAQFGPDYRQQGAFESLRQLTGRQSSKNLRYSPQAVWPPEAKNMGRNKFLADFIAEKTSVPRSTKQVASRLQQLRGSAQDGRVKQLILGRPVPEFAVDPLTMMCPTTTSEVNERLDPDTPFQVNIRLLNTRQPSLPSVVSLDYSISSPPVIQLAVLLEWRSFTRLLHGQPRKIGIVSPIRLMERCHWRVSLRDSHWMTPADLNCESVSEGDWIYTAKFAENIWSMICDDHNAKWVIYQYLFGADNNEVSSGGGLVAEIVYTFENDVSRPTSKALGGGGYATAKLDDVNLTPQVLLVRAVLGLFLRLKLRFSLKPATTRQLSTPFCSLSDWDKMPSRLADTASQVPPPSANAKHVSVHVDPQADNHFCSYGRCYDPQHFIFYFTD